MTLCADFFSVRENVYYTGLMKRKANEDPAEIAHRVEELLSILGLSQVVSSASWIIAISSYSLWSLG
jgi:ABC-type multidrug transport system ATPase subunit